MAKKSGLDRIAWHRPMPRSEAEHILLVAQYGLWAMFKGIGIAHDWAKVAVAINMTRCLVEQQKDNAAPIRLADLAQNVMLDVRKRAMKTSAFKVRPKEIEPLHDVMRLYEDLLARVSYIQYNDACDTVNNRLRERADNDTARRNIA